jgi:hypothetical protein
MIKITTLIAALTLTACSTSIYPTFTPTGGPGYRLVCGGIFGDGDTGACYQQAGQICKANGYRVLQTGVSSLIIECRDGPAALTPETIQAR